MADHQSCWRSMPQPPRCSLSLLARCAPTPASRKAKRSPPGSTSTVSIASCEASTPQVRSGERQPCLFPCATFSSYSLTFYLTCNLVFNMLYKLSLDSVQRCPYLTYSAMQKYLDLLTFFVVLLSYDAIYALINAPFSDFLLSQNTFLSICLFVCFLSEVYKTVALCLFLSQTLARVPSQQSHLRSPKCCLAWRNWRSFHWWMKPMPRPQQAISPAPRRLLRNGAGSCLNVVLRTSLSKVKKNKHPKVSEQESSPTLRPKAMKTWAIWVGSRKM